jgi:hypothetical protein
MTGMTGFRAHTEAKLRLAAQIAKAKDSGAVPGIVPAVEALAKAKAAMGPGGMANPKLTSAIGTQAGQVTPENFAERVAKAKMIGALMQAAKAAKVGAVAKASVQEELPEMPCKMCGTVLSAGEQVCPGCGYDRSKPQPEAANSARKPPAGLAAAVAALTRPNTTPPPAGSGKAESPAKASAKTSLSELLDQMQNSAEAGKEGKEASPEPAPATSSAPDTSSAPATSPTTEDTASAQPEESLPKMPKLSPLDFLKQQQDRYRQELMQKLVAPQLNKMQADAPPVASGTSPITKAFAGKAGMVVPPKRKAPLAP